MGAVTGVAVIENGMSPAAGEADSTSRLAPCFAACVVAALAFIEPAMGRLEKLGDALEAKQYLFIMPTGEIAYLVPALREVPVSAVGLVGLLLLLVGVFPAARRFKEKGADSLSALGLGIFATGCAMMASEYVSKGEWVFWRVGVRYLASTMIALGSFLCYRNRRYLAVLGIGGFIWDLSSAVFWACLERDPGATVPVPWCHHFDQREGRGAPCWLVALLDTLGVAFFAWMAGSDFDPLKIFID
jgi:hypothetical protein